MLLALLLGLAVNFLRDDPALAGGIEFAAKNLLKIGVALLGLRISLAAVVSNGSIGPLIVIGAMASTFVVGAIGARFAGLSTSFGKLSAGSVAICGVSAAIAIASVLPKRSYRDEELAMVIISVTALSTVAMILYPIIAGLLGFSDVEAGIFIGGSIHDVAQVIGAGYSISPEAGDSATYIKLMRVAMLLPIVLVLALTTGSKSGSVLGKGIRVPGFLIVFVLLAGVTSMGWVAAPVTSIGTELSKLMLVIAIFATGARSSLKELASVGYFPLLLITVETVAMAGLIVAGLAIL